MPCEHYKDALIEAAASGLAPQGELRPHLLACASCRETLAQERSLFAAIDSGLHAAANAEVLPSLLPRVRASLETIPVSLSRWTPGWFALSGASLVAATLLVAVAGRHNLVGIQPVQSAANRPSVQEAVPPMPRSLPPASFVKHDAIPRPSMPPARVSVAREQAMAVQPAPEVLVLRDQEVLLASYAQQWSSRKRAPLVAGDVDQTVVTLLEVAPIQIAELDVKPLAEGNSQ